MLARSPAGVTSLRRDMVAFRGVQSDHRGWSEIGAISRKAAPHSPGRLAGAPGAIVITSLTAGVVCKKQSAMDQHNNRSDDPKPVIEPSRDGAQPVELTTRALH